MAKETEEIGTGGSPAPPAPKTYTGPLQLGGATAKPTGAPLTAAPASSPQGPMSPPAMPASQGGLFPAAPPPSLSGMGAPAGPPAVAPPSSSARSFLPPNYQSVLGQAGFFSGPGASQDQGGANPMDWLKQLFSGLTR